MSEKEKSKEKVWTSGLTQPKWVYRRFPWFYWLLTISATLLSSNNDYYFVRLMGLDALTYAWLIVIYAVINAFNGPLIAHYIERDDHKWIEKRGRRRPFIAIFTWISPIVLLFAYLTPGPIFTSQIGYGILIVFWLCLSDTISDFANTALTSLLPEKFKTDDDRKKYFGIYYPGVYIVAIIGFGLPVITGVLTGVFGGDDAAAILAVRIMAGVGVIIKILGFLISLKAFKDPDDYLEIMKNQDPRPNLWIEFKNMAKLVNFWVFILYGMTNALFFTVMTGAFPFFIEFYYGYDPGSVFMWFAAFGAAFYLASLAGNFLWTAVLDKTKSKVTTFIWANSVMVLGAIAIFVLAYFRLPVYILIAVGTPIMGLGYGHGTVIGQMGTDFADEYAFTMRRRSQSLVATFQGIANRLVVELQNFILAGIFIITNFTPDPDIIPGAAAQMGMLLQVTLIPAAFGILGILIIVSMWRMSNEKRGKIIAGLKELGI